MENLTERLNNFSVEANQLAKEKGWWDGEERDTRELYALMHSEVSEALEEYRAGRPMIWHLCKSCLNPCETCFECVCKDQFPDGKGCVDFRPKPEGIAVELIDLIIRIADFMGHTGIQFVQEWDVNYDCNTPLPVLCQHLHAMLDEAISEGYMDWATGEIIEPDDIGDNMTEITLTIFSWLAGKGIDPWAVLDEKHQFNKTRPYRHGNKVC